jgi:competence protein ComEC
VGWWGGHDGVARAGEVAIAGGAQHAARRRRRRRIVLTAALVLLVLVALSHVRGRRGSTAPPPPGTLRVTALDVGQGDATLLQADGTAVLVDTGPEGAPTAKQLRTAGVERLDLLVLSHAAADHVGAAADVLRRLSVATLLDGRDGDRSVTSRAIDAAAGRRRVRVVAPRAGDVLTVGPITLRVLWPRPAPRIPGTDPNDRALVAEATAFGRTVLLTADAESPVLAPLDLEPVDVLKVSHHGSDDPGLPALLARLRPRVALLEVGRRNMYGHPAPSTLRALGVVASVLRTDRDGSVRVDLAGT